MLPGRLAGAPASATAPDPPPRGPGGAGGRAERRIERGLFVLGFAALGICAAVLLEAGLYQAIQGGRLDRAWWRAGREAGPASPGAGRLVGRIEIPRIRLSAVIREGIDPHTLLIAAGHVPGTALPGEAGNVVVSAHRDTFFRPLRRIRSGDTIRIVTADAAYHYRVDASFVTTPDHTAVLAPAETGVLTLITCYPFNFIGPAPQRFIVRARQLEPPQRAAG